MAERGGPASAVPAGRGDSGGAAVPAEPKARSPAAAPTTRTAAAPAASDAALGFNAGESLELWNRTRAEWLARTGGTPRPPGPRRAVLSNDVTYTELLESTAPFPKPVPLAEVVDFLVECWVDDGLYAKAQQLAPPPRSRLPDPGPVQLPPSVAAELAQNALPPLVPSTAKRRGRPPGVTAAVMRERAAEAAAASAARARAAPPPPPPQAAPPRPRGRPRKQPPPPAAAMRARGPRAAPLPLLHARTLCAL